MNKLLCYFIGWILLTAGTVLTVYFIRSFIFWDLTVYSWEAFRAMVAGIALVIGYHAVRGYNND